MKRITLIILWSLVFCHLYPQNASDHFFAVIVSGGRNRLLNHERYWNDCAFLYRTLRQTYHLPQRNISLLIADGDNPAADMLKEGATGFASSPTDLDGDGLPDLHLAATRANLKEVMQQLSIRLTDSDHLFIYIIDHGELASNGDAVLWLWNNEELRPSELASLLAPLRPASMAVLLGQCHAGAFVPWLRGENRVVMAACQSDELSWACTERPYDEFVYHWTCAIAGHDEHHNAVNSDLNGDQRISLDEAFHFACQHDQRPETPTLWSDPPLLASHWSFYSVVTNAIAITSADAAIHHTFDLQGRPLPATHAHGLLVERGRLTFKKR